MTKREIRKRISQKLVRELAHYDGSWNSTNIVEAASLFSGLVVIEIARTNLGDGKFKWNTSLYSGNVCDLDQKGILAEFGGLTAENAVMSVDSANKESAIEVATFWAHTALKNNTNIIG
ncbi:hypothetical protein HW260_02100 [Helicobacter cinaedi]|uniref:Uncharacterized protein n=1 Tax=Helicobacter cinaedi CCUG 18818 = ATCC BAA-847 TaxID=537971 RepID=A0AAI8MNB1_9HELI|nr:hypothetical protein [Helicobacter cinaedi]EFR45490.1 hypothetical protein HCCG_00036 [Helicobacter cinaedi CCUG 18818 = ATCC BAA-847]QOQ91173.1 hypothetical protein HW260_02100 [Helicobacter cinaedi]BAM32870.1 hypothetical protein HCBAA847_1640 [Helicobacter cinaedi CCUG 18818 = ATCC BAA-847]